MASLPPLSVLVVDDEPDLVESTVALLELHGYRARGETGGEQAVEAAAADPPDVALVDLGMPGIDGFEVARRLRRLPRPPFLVAVTGRTSDWDRDQAGLAGFGVYLTKPVPPSELIDLIRMCDQSRGWSG